MPNLDSLDELAKTLTPADIAALGKLLERKIDKKPNPNHRSKKVLTVNHRYSCTICCAINVVEVQVAMTAKNREFANKNQIELEVVGCPQCKDYFENMEKADLVDFMYSIVCCYRKGDSNLRTLKEYL